MIMTIKFHWKRRTSNNRPHGSITEPPDAPAHAHPPAFHHDRIAGDHETQVHDYLVASAGIDNGQDERQEEIGVSFTLILLLWEHDVAYRAGIVVVWIPRESFDPFWKEAKPSLRKFWFG